MGKDVEVKVRIDSEQANQGLGSLKKALVGMAGALAVTGAVKALGGALVDCAKGAMEAEAIQTELASVLESTKGKAGLTADSINSLAGSLSKVTMFEDDAIVSGENMLLTFTNIGKNVFPRATESMLNMAQKFGSVEAASMQLGKALNDPLAGLGALRKVGVAFTTEQELMIKALMGNDEELKKLAKAAGQAELGMPKLSGALEVAKLKLKEMTEKGKASESSILAQKNKIGELAAEMDDGQASIKAYAEALKLSNSGMSEAERLEKAQAIILGELEVEFGGLAKAAGETTAGKLEILKNSFGNIKDSIGGALTTLATKLMEVLNSPQIQAGIANITAWLGGSLPGIIDKGLGYLTNTILPALKTALAFVSENWESFRLAIVAIGAALIAVQIAGFIASLNPLTVIIAAIAGAVALFKLGWDSDWHGMRTTLEAVGAGIAKAFEAVKTWLTVTLPEGVGTAIQWFKDLPKKVGEAALGLRDKVIGIGRSIVEGIIEGVKGWWENLKAALWGLIGGLVDWIKKLLGIASPSTVFAAIGVNMMKGLAEGIAAGAAMPAIALSGAAAGAALTTVNQYNLTIHSSATTESVRQDFYVMRALAGV